MDTIIKLTAAERGYLMLRNVETGAMEFRVSEKGGEPVPVTELDTTRKETGHRWPSFLPDGKHFLFVALPAKQGNFDVFLASLDSKVTAVSVT